MTDTQKVRYVGPLDEVEVAGVAETVVKGRLIEVPSELAARLLEQPDNWLFQKPKTPTPDPDPTPSADVPTLPED